ncbi:MAG: hypothetical protein LUG51_00500 [Tannerellaceae bacterium]|nr:hypothetical protein [Tannerellaceae bacterium]
MLEVFKQYVCDECGALIESPSQGLLEWRNKLDSNGKTIATGFRIVHHIVVSPLRGVRPEGCYRYAPDSPDSECRPLSSILPVATPFLMAFLHPGCFHSASRDSCRIKDFNEFADLVRRLTIPYYEEARIYFEEALEDGFNYCDKETVFRETNLQSLIRRYKGKSI